MNWRNLVTITLLLTSSSIIAQPIGSRGPSEPPPRLIPECSDLKFSPFSERYEGLEEFSIEFSVGGPYLYDGEPSPYVELGELEGHLRHLEAASQIVLPSRKLRLILDYPLDRPWGVSVRAPSSTGFSRADLARIVGQIYQCVYQIEGPPAPKGDSWLSNRPTSSGKFGIWGHGIQDLGLSSVNIFRGRDGKLLAWLTIDS